MTHSRISDIIRQFPQNGLKLLLHTPANVRDLLRLAGWKLVRLLDFSKMAVDPTTYVSSDYRHVESDLVLTVPLRHRPGERKGRRITLYILIEHQSEPDRLMVLRLLDYMVQIWKAQARRVKPRRRSLASLRLEPILPIVFYTGTRGWEEIIPLSELIAEGKAFADVTPAFRPLFINLPELNADQLETNAGYFGWVLRLVQERKARTGEFRELLARVVAHLEELPEADRLRWVELLSYVHALVYHEREEGEVTECHDLIRDAVRSETLRREVTEMGRTYAQKLLEEGREKGSEEGREEGALRAKRQTLVRLLRQRFGAVPAATVRIIEATDDATRLDHWLDRFANAVELADVQIRREV